MSRRYRLLILTLIFLLAAAGRMLNIDSESLWVDEGFSYWAIRGDSLADTFDVVLNDVHPPVYFVMLKGWSALTGISELALRYLSVIPSLLAVAMVYQVAREILLLAKMGNSRRGDLSGRPRASLGRPELISDIIPILAALMMALADMENYIAQETRMYTWHVLWVTVSMWAFLRWIRQQTPAMTSSRRPQFFQLVWFVATLLLLYTHYIGAAAVAAQGLFALIFLRGRLRLTALATLTVIGILFVPWLLVVASNQTANIGTGFNVPSTLASLWNYRDEWFTAQWALMIGLALMGVWGIWCWGYDDNGRAYEITFPRTGLAVLLLSWIIVPVAGAYVLNFYTPILIDYRLTQITPAVALLIAFGLGTFNGRTMLFLVMVILVYGVATNDTPRPRPPWRAVGMDAARYAESGDLALAQVTPSGDWQVIYYYDRFMPDGVDKRSLRQWQLELGYDDYFANLPPLMAQHDHIWLMHWSSDLTAFDMLRDTGHVQTALMSEDWLGNDLNVYRFDIVPPEEDALGRFENGMILRDAIIHPDQMRVDLWWSADTLLEADYSVSARLLDANGVLVAQVDSFPFENQRPTTTWASGEVVYDPRTLSLADGISDLPAGTYTVAVSVYLWTPAGILNQQTATAEDSLIVGEWIVD